MKIVIASIIIISIILFAFIIPNLSPPKNLGLIGDRLAPVPSSPNAVSSQAGQNDKYVDPLPLYGSVAESQKKILNILIQIGCEIVTVSEVYIHATHTSTLFHFRDDLEFFFDNNEELIHFRSVSRVGYSDLGVNRKRYMEIKESYNSNQ